MYQKCNAERPQDLVVYSLDGAYFVEMQLRFEPVPTRMFYFWGMFSISGGFEVGKPTEEERAGNPYQPYLVELSAQKVFQLLQRKVDTAPEDKLRRS